MLFCQAGSADLFKDHFATQKQTFLKDEMPNVLNTLKGTISLEFQKPTPANIFLYSETMSRLRTSPPDY